MALNRAMRTAVEHPRIAMTTMMLLIMLLFAGDPAAAATGFDSGGFTTMGATIGDGGP